MLRMLRRESVLVVLVLIFCASWSSAAEGGVQWLVSPELLKEAKLEIVWQNELPLKKKENLKDLHILGNRLYVLTDRNYLVSINREKGSFVFSNSVAPVGFPVMGLELYKDEIMSVISDELVEINLETGAKYDAKRVSFGVVCPAARNSSYYYLAGADRRVHAFQAEDKVQVFEVAADNDSAISSIIADEEFVIFGTDGGNVISIAPNGPRRQWQFDAGGGIGGPIVRDGNSLFFASKDTNVYRVDIVGLPLRKQLAWKYQTAGVLENAPRVTRGVVYQYVPGKGVTAIDKGGGTLLWSVPGGADLLAEAMDKAYIITKNRTLVVMDNLSAKKLYSVNFAEATRYAANIADSKIYIADEQGRIACLQPVE